MQHGRQPEQRLSARGVDRQVAEYQLRTLGNVSRRAGL